jgi:hypothetical protein
MNLAAYYFVVATLCNPTGTVCKQVEYLAGETVQECMINGQFRLSSEVARTGWHLKGGYVCVKGIPS